MSYRPPSFVDACSHLVRKLVQTAYSMAANSVRPANQGYPAGNEAGEFATVKIMDGPDSDFGTWSTTWLDDPTTNSTKVIENMENVYRFTASVQFFHHTAPAVDGAGLSPFGLGAVDKAARLATILSSTAMMDLMERMGLGLEDSSSPRDVSALVQDATWEDRGSVDLTFTIVNREQFLLESIATADVTLKVQEPGSPTLTTETIEVTT